MTRSNGVPLLASLLVTASTGAMALAGASCSTTTAQFTGTEHAPLIDPSEVLDFGVDQPEGHEVIGVASVRCETTNGASGLLSVPCTEEAMTGLIRARAADAGGTGLVELRCNTPDTRRVLQNVDGGSVQQSTLSGLVCHATVVRRREGVVVGAPPPASAEPSARTGGRRVSISGQPVEVGADRPPSGAPTGPSSEVGQLEAFPDGYADAGRIWARCLRGCARSVARRAVLQEARRHGAQAIAELSCSLEGERWRCEARVVGAPIEPSSTAEPASTAAPIDPATGGQAPSLPVGGGGAGGHP